MACDMGRTLHGRNSVFSAVRWSYIPKAAGESKAMQANTCQKEKFALKWRRPEAPVRSIDEPGRRGQVDDLCITLFDRWCERRELLALTYLLHAWPLFASTRPPLRRLSATLRELLTFHANALDELDRDLIANIQHLADC